MHHTVRGPPNTGEDDHTSASDGATPLHSTASAINTSVRWATHAKAATSVTTSG